MLWHCGQVRVVANSRLEKQFPQMKSACWRTRWIVSSIWRADTPPFQFSVLLTHDKTYPELKLLKHPPRHQHIWGKKGKRKQDEWHNLLNKQNARSYHKNTESRVRHSCVALILRRGRELCSRSQSQAAKKKGVWARSQAQTHRSQAESSLRWEVGGVWVDCRTPGGMSDCYRWQLVRGWASAGSAWVS